ncbi:MAG: coenzyme A pyrophosphatase, partial [Bacteroidota bacterium]
MEFNRFYPQLLKIKNLPLPGGTSHDKMSPAFRKQLMEKEKIAQRNPKRAAVMALFYPDEIQTT